MKINLNQKNSNITLNNTTADLIKITGYASVFNQKDKQNDIVIPGSFFIDKKIEEIPFLWQHNSNQPIGYLTVAKEDNYGLYIEANITNKTQIAQEAIDLIKQKITTKLSIGFDILDYFIDKNVGITYLKKIKLIEVSLVTFPANELTNVAISNKLL